METGIEYCVRPLSNARTTLCYEKVQRWELRHTYRIFSCIWRRMRAFFLLTSRNHSCISFSSSSLLPAIQHHHTLSAYTNTAGLSQPGHLQHGTGLLLLSHIQCSSRFKTTPRRGQSGLKSGMVLILKLYNTSVLYNFRNTVVLAF